MNDFVTGNAFSRAVAAHLGLQGHMVMAGMSVDTDPDDALAVNLTVLLGPDDLVSIGKLMRGEVPAKTSIGELTVKLDTSLVRDAIREMMEPGAMYLPASAVAKVYSRTGASTRLMQECGAIVADEATPTTPFEDAVAAGRKVVHVDVPDADDKVRFVWMDYNDTTEAQRLFAVGRDGTSVPERYAIPVDQLTAHQRWGAKIETL